jgi:hypothetical protein
MDMRKSSVILCDLDGTLFLRGERGPHDHERCTEDAVNPAVRYLLRRFGPEEIVLMSGREEIFRVATQWALQFQHINYRELIMRKWSDTRKDYIVKRELYEEFVAPFYTVRFVLDDRNSVVEMWREHGLPCFQVQPGDF